MSKPVVPGHVWLTNWDGTQADLDYIKQEWGKVTIGPPKGTRLRSQAAIAKDGIKGIYIPIDEATQRYEGYADE